MFFTFSTESLGTIIPLQDLKAVFRIATLNPLHFCNNDKIFSSQEHREKKLRVIK